MHKKLMIFLHGVGSCGDDLLAVGKFWQKLYPDIVIASPNAPEHFMNSPDAFQWFSILGVTQENRLERIEQARPAFDEMMQRIIEQHHFENHLDQVFFCGFSQGTIMALDAVASGRWNIAGVIGFSGRLATPIQDHLTHKPKILLLHGQDDQVISVQESQYAAQAFSDAGFETTFEMFSGLGHTISQIEFEKCFEFLRAQ